MNEISTNRDIARYHANRVRAEVETLRRDLRGTIQRAQEALTALDNDQRVGTGVAGQVLGQNARDVETTATKLNTMLEVAHDLGITEEDLRKVYAGEWLGE